MKKVFRPHIILLIGGRFLTLLIIIFSIVMLCGGCYFVFVQNESKMIFILLTQVGSCVLTYFVFKYYLWQLAWGKLILKEDYLVWKCLFCRSVKISYKDIEYMEIRSAAEENYIKADPYHVGFYYILMSTSQLPRKPVGKMFCKKGLIKWAYSAKVCFALKERVPTRWKGLLNRKYGFW